MTFYKLSEFFGWTPTQIGELTPNQIGIYLRIMSGVEKRKSFTSLPEAVAYYRRKQGINVKKI